MPLSTDVRLTVGADFVDYEFRDADYAAAFCTANDGEIR